MILSGKKLREFADEHIIVPPGEDSPVVGPASIDLRIGPQGLIPMGGDGAGVSIKNPGTYREIELPTTFAPGEMVLLSSIEEIHMPPDVAAFVAMRSSAGRLGLDHAMAGFVDPGFHGTITFEISNIRPRDPIYLEPGDRIVQMVFFTCTEAAAYTGGYNGQSGPKGVRENAHEVG